MAFPVLPIVIALSFASTPLVDLNAKSKDPMSCMRADKSIILIADSHGGEDPHGSDPHGGDPHDENHDAGLPANEHDRNRNPNPGPYGPDVPNGKGPYIPQ
jgi:hypothetical protein